MTDSTSNSLAERMTPPRAAASTGAGPTPPDTAAARRATLCRALGLHRAAACALGALAVTPAEALELGEASVRSALGQRPVIDIPYTLAPGERLEAACLSLVRSGTDGLPVLTRAAIGIPAAGSIRVTGSEPVREPLLGLTLKTDCPQAPRIERGYSLLIDPPVLVAAHRTGTEPVATAPEPRPARATAGAKARSAASAGTPQRSASPSASGGDGRADGRPRRDIEQGTSYRVRRGDTLSTIAERVSGRPSGLWETAERLFEENPAAFTANDPDWLLAGAELVIPVLTAPAAAERAAGVATGTVEEAPAAPATVTAAARSAGPSRAPAAPPTAFDPEPVEPAAPGDTGSDTDAVKGNATQAQIETAGPASRVETAPPAREPAQRTGPVTLAGEQAAPGEPEPASPFLDENAGAAAVASDTAAAVPKIDDEAATADGTTTVDAAAQDRGGMHPLLAALFGAAIGLVLGLLVLARQFRELARRRRRDADAKAVARDLAVLQAAKAAVPEEPAIIVEEPSWTTNEDLEIDADLTSGEGLSADAEGGDGVHEAIHLGDRAQSVALDLELPEQTETELDEALTGRLPAASPEGAAEDRPGETAGGPLRDPGGQRGEDAAAAQPETPPAAAASPGPVENIDFELLTKDYEDELTATQKLEAALAEAALQLTAGEGGEKGGSDTGNDAEADAETVEMPAEEAPTREMPAAQPHWDRTGAIAEEGSAVMDNDEQREDEPADEPAIDAADVAEAASGLAASFDDAMDETVALPQDWDEDELAAYAHEALDDPDETDVLDTEDLRRTRTGS